MHDATSMRPRAAGPPTSWATTGVDERQHALLTAFVVTATVAVVAAIATMLALGRPPEVLYARWILHNAPTALALLWLGRAIARRSPRHGLVRVFLVAGGVSALHIVVISIADLRMVAAGAGTEADLIVVPADLPWDAAVPLWASSWLWLISAVFGVIYCLLLFPDGRLPSPRWRPVAAGAGVGLAMIVAAIMITVWPTTTQPFALTQQATHDGPALLLWNVGSLLVAGTACASVGSLVVRWRAADPVLRQQLRIVGVAGGVLAAGLVLLWPWQQLWVPVSMVLIVAFIVSYGVAVLRFRLHDVDVALNRTLVAAILAVLVFLVYLATVVVVGELVGRRADHPLVPLLAVGAVAVLIEPTRRRVRRTVDRLLYRRDVDASEVLSDLASHLGAVHSTTAVLERVATLLVRGTGATAARVTRHSDGATRTLAQAGDPSGEPTLTATVVHDLEELGGIELFARRAGDLAPDAPVLVQQVAATLGAVLRSDLLAHQLEGQLQEVQRSRARLVEAQDLARRDLERDLHDGAQAHLVGVKLRLGLLAERLERTDTSPSLPSATPPGATLPDAAASNGHLDAQDLRTLVAELSTETDAAIRSLRQLAGGLHPPVLRSDGVAPALRAAARGLPIEVTVADDDVGRYAPEVEAAVYFCCLEAVKNAATHAGATRVEVSLGRVDDHLRFEVTDDGRGFDPAAVVPGQGLRNLGDRISALGGRVDIEAAPGRGSSIAGVVPVQPLVADR